MFSIQNTPMTTQGANTPTTQGANTPTTQGANTQQVILDQLNKMQNDIINLKLAIEQLIMINKHMIVDKYKNQ